jgi:hypothetical protein
MSFYFKLESGNSDYDDHSTVTMNIIFEEQPSWHALLEKFHAFLKANDYVFAMEDRFEIVNYREAGKVAPLDISESLDTAYDNYPDTLDEVKIKTPAKKKRTK